MVEVIIEILALVLTYIMGILLGKRIAEKEPKGKLRIVRDEEGEPFIFLEFYSRAGKLEVETLEDGELITLQISHK